MKNRIDKKQDAALPKVAEDTVYLPFGKADRIDIALLALCDGSEPHPIKCLLCPCAPTCKNSLAVS